MFKIYKIFLVKTVFIFFINILLFSQAQIRFNINEVLSRKSEKISSDIINSSDSSKINEAGNTGTLQKKLNSLDLNRINSSVERPRVSLHILEEDINVLEGYLDKLHEELRNIRQHICETKQELDLVNKEIKERAIKDSLATTITSTTVKEQAKEIVKEPISQENKITSTQEAKDR
jgi:hypothetical protein